MKKLFLAALILTLFTFACARTWEYRPIESFKPSVAAPPAEVCQTCHPREFDAWKQYQHSSPDAMARVPLEELRECGACHENAAAHAQNPGPAFLPSITKLSRTEQNTICGKCHYNQSLFGSKAINPHDKHGLFMSVGLEGQQRQIGCLDCHSGHHGGSAMLVSIKAHICFTCHKEAIVTMGVFQPFNYLFFGKACQGCHTVHGGSSGERWGRMGVGFCVVCHVVGTSLVGGE